MSYFPPLLTPPSIPIGSPLGSSIRDEPVDEHEKLVVHYARQKQNCLTKCCILSCFISCACFLKLIKFQIYIDSISKTLYKVHCRSCRSTSILDVKNTDKRLEEIDSCCTKTIRINADPPSVQNDNNDNSVQPPVTIAITEATTAGEQQSSVLTRTPPPLNLGLHEHDEAIVSPPSARTPGKKQNEHVHMNPLTSPVGVTKSFTYLRDPSFTHQNDS